MIDLKEIFKIISLFSMKISMIELRISAIYYPRSFSCICVLVWNARSRRNRRKRRRIRFIWYSNMTEVKDIISWYLLLLLAFTASFLFSVSGIVGVIVVLSFHFVHWRRKDRCRVVVVVVVIISDVAAIGSYSYKYVNQAREEKRGYS